MGKNEDYAKEVADSIIEALSNGTAPWIKPWAAKDLMAQSPYNPMTNNHYNGINMVNLLTANIKSQFNDPRWLTYKQAKSINAQVRSGERGTSIQYWKFKELIDHIDGSGKKVLNEKGEPQKIEVALENPRVFYATVFNAAQIDNMPKLDLGELEAKRTFEPFIAAEHILTNSGADIVFQTNGKSAHYHPGSDRITLPQREQFSSESLFYATALHELGHWTGHESRLDRDLSNPFGSQGYAKEELRAEIASFMMCAELGLDFDPGHHVAYVASWVKALEEQPKEIFRAASDSSKILNFIMDLNCEIDLTKEVAQMKPDEITNDLAATPEHKLAPILAAEKTLLFVPFAQKEAAKKLGAKWDKEQKSWYVDAGADLSTGISQWILASPQTALESYTKEDPHIEFARELSQYGLEIEGDPIMDGKIHRAKVEGDKGQEKSGAYMAYLDGRPAGYIQNFKTGVKENWKASAFNKELSQSQALTPQQMQAHKQALEDKALLRQQELHEKHLTVSQKVSLEFEAAPIAENTHPYLVEKGIPSHGLKLDERGNLLMPLRDVEGKIWTTQHIGVNGYKGFEPGGKKEGHFFLIGEDPSLSKSLLICEGYATGASIHAATDKTVIVAVDAGNLESVSKALRERYPDKEIFLAADNDMKKELEGKENVGRIKAEHAAQAVKGVVLIPQLTTDQIKAGMSDFNDIHKSRGLAELKKQLEIKMDHYRNKDEDFKPNKEVEQSSDKRVQLDFAMGN